jgi:hypothetical protein
MTPGEQVVRFESFCQDCKKRLLVSVAEAGLVWPTGAMLNTRSGCCGGYVERIASVVPAAASLDRTTYQKPVSDAPLSASTWAWHAAGGAKKGEINFEFKQASDATASKVGDPEISVAKARKGKRKP